jgi:anti-sigma B factor antagonist
MNENEINKKVLRDDKIVIELGEALDNSNAGELLEILYSSLSDGFIYIILDMTNLEHLSSAGVGTILGSLEAAREARGDIVLCNVPENILHILQVLDLADFLTIKPGIKEAAEFKK